MHAEYYLSKADIKDYNVIDRKIFFDQSIQSFVQSYENNRKIIVDQDDYTYLVAYLITLVSKKIISWFQ